MAKKFAGFTPEQLGKIVPEMKGMQADEQKKFLAANPAAAKRVGVMSEKAQMALAKGGYIKGYDQGGFAKQFITDQNRAMERFAANNATTEFDPAQLEAEPAQAMDLSQLQKVAQQQQGIQAPAYGLQRPLPANTIGNTYNRLPRPVNPFAEQAEKAIDEHEKNLITQLNFDPSTIRSEEDYVANKDKYDQFVTQMQSFINSNDTVNQARTFDLEQGNQLRSGGQNQVNVGNPALNQSKQEYAAKMKALQDAKNAQAANPEDETLVKAVEDAQANLTLAQEQYNSSLDQFKATNMPSTAEAISGGITDPSSMVTATGVEGVDVNANQIIDPTTGQLTTPAPKATVTDAVAAPDVAVEPKPTAPTVDATKVTEGVRTEVEGATAATGEVSKTVDAAQGELSDGATVAEDRKVADDRIVEAEAGTRKVTDQEQITGATMNEMPAADAAMYEGEVPASEAAKFKGKTPTAEPQDYYNLTPTQIAEMEGTAVNDAAKADYYPTADAAKSDFQSMVNAAQGSVGANEIVNAKDIVATAEAVKATAAIMDTLNEQAVAKAATGSFNQNMLATAATGSVPAEATVSGQIDKLMQQFNNGTPAWAGASMRAAKAAMAARGIKGGSVSDAAMVRAMMEAAVPIAQADAAVFERMNMKNVDNRQQVALTNAAAEQGLTLQNLSNEQAVALQNSSNAFALQKESLSNQQAVVLANAQFKAGLQEQVLGIDTQISLTNASKYAEKNNINLSNAQQAMLQRSSENLQVEMSNLSNEQQTALSALQVQASLMGQELTNEQQVAMLDSTQRFEAAQFNATQKQKAFLQDAAAQSAMEGKALDARQQTQLFNISSILEERKIELTNEQQTRIFNTTNAVNVDLEEMSNRQQTALANVQIEATLRGQELNNKQQAAVLNAEKFAEANNLTYTTEAQMQLANSQMMQTVGLAEMDAQSAAALANAAQIASMDMANLNNRQQAQVENAKNFLQMDMANLSNEQQTTMFKMQSVVNSMLSDQAADNAAKQFNASSQMQTDQFFANLSSTVKMFNSEQNNKIEMLNAGEKNALSKFNSELINMRDQFNATNSLVVEQANTQWFQTVATTDTAALNEANRLDAAAANNMTNLAFNALMQETRDLMSFAWQTANNDADRATQLSIAKISSDDAKASAAAQKSVGLWGAIGSFAAALFR